MRIKVELEKGESPEDADAFLAKASTAKHECTGQERYADSWLNELEAYVVEEHRKILVEIFDQVAHEVSAHADQQ